MLVLDTVTNPKKDQVVILCEALDLLVTAEVEEESVSNVIVENIRYFLIISEGRDKTDELQTKKQYLLRVHILDHITLLVWII